MFQYFFFSQHFYAVYLLTGLLTVTERSVREGDRLEVISEPTDTSRDLKINVFSIAVVLNVCLSAAVWLHGQKLCCCKVKLDCSIALFPSLPSLYSFFILPFAPIFTFLFQCFYLSSIIPVIKLKNHAGILKQSTDLMPL